VREVILKLKEQFVFELSEHWLELLDKYQIRNLIVDKAHINFELETLFALLVALDLE
jgi:hypothetical protein